MLRTNEEVDRDLDNLIEKTEMLKESLEMAVVNLGKLVEISKRQEVELKILGRLVRRAARSS